MSGNVQGLKTIELNPGNPIPQMELWYVEKLFIYTNQLLERTQQRSNYLIFSNSVSAVAFTTTVNLIISNHIGRNDLIPLSMSLQIALIPVIILFLSIFIAVLSFLPKVYKTDIDINHHLISEKTIQEYTTFLRAKSDSEKIDDFISEIHVLSKILNDKNRLVSRSARVFIASIISMAIVIFIMLA